MVCALFCCVATAIPCRIFVVVIQGYLLRSVGCGLMAAVYALRNVAILQAGRKAVFAVGQRGISAGFGVKWLLQWRKG